MMDNNAVSLFPKAENCLISIIYNVNISVPKTIVCNFHMISSQLIS